MSKTSKLPTRGYVAFWHGGGSYSAPLPTHAEYFPSVVAARNEFRDRYWGRSTQRRVTFEGDGFLESIGDPERLYTPAVDREASMGLYAIFQDPDGDVTYSEGIAFRLTFGPRGGVVVERG